MRIDSLNVAQRIVLVITTGLVLLVAVWVVTVENTAAAGWFNYAPNSETIVQPDSFRFSPTVVATITVAAVLLWASISLRLLRSASRPT